MQIAEEPQLFCLDQIPSWSMCGSSDGRPCFQGVFLDENIENLARMTYEMGIKETLPVNGHNHLFHPVPQLRSSSFRPIPQVHQNSSLRTSKWHMYICPLEKTYSQTSSDKQHLTECAYCLQVITARSMLPSVSTSKLWPNYPANIGVKNRSFGGCGHHENSPDAFPPPEYHAASDPNLCAQWQTVDTLHRTHIIDPGELGITDPAYSCHIPCYALSHEILGESAWNRQSENHIQKWADCDLLQNF